VLLIVNVFIDPDYTDDFCFYNADTNRDGIINLLDVIAVANIFSEGKANPYPGTVSDEAHLYMHSDGMYLESDGTLAGVQFTLLGTPPQGMEIHPDLENFNLVYTTEGEKTRAMVFSLGNARLPEGQHQLLRFTNTDDLPAWADAFAGNYNAQQVPVNTHHDTETSVGDIQEKVSWNVYPNPVRDKLTIEVSNAPGYAISVSLVNVHGQKVMEHKTSGDRYEQMHFDVRDIPAGLYVLRIKYDSFVATEKISVR